MMVATLNKMPEDPAQHMKDYISLHYFFEKENKNTSVQSQQADEEMRANLRSQDLKDLKKELQLMQEENLKFKNLKTAFTNFTRKMNEISRDGYVPDHVAHQKEEQSQKVAAMVKREGS